MDLRKLADAFKGRDSIVIIKKIEIPDVPKLFPGKDTVSFGEFRQRMGQNLQLNQRESNQVMQGMKERGAIDVNQGKGKIFFKPMV